jgi:hypothetical protein
VAALPVPSLRLGSQVLDPLHFFDRFCSAAPPRALVLPQPCSRHPLAASARPFAAVDPIPVDFASFENISTLEKNVERGQYKVNSMTGSTRRPEK